jgi:microcystin-dependent protein
MFGTPLPAALSGDVVQRLIEVDQALLYLITGALDYLLDHEPLDQTGALTVENARDALSDMFYIYLDEEPMTVPVGSTMLWHMDMPPDRWIICDGSGVLKADYPQLWALFGSKYGSSVDYFGVPDLRGRSPFGADFTTILDATAGALTHTLTTAQIPAHSHGITDPGHTHRVPKQSVTVNAGVNVATPAARTDNPATPHIISDSATTGISINGTGGGGAHNNLHPVLGVNFIVYGGRA